MPEIKCLYLQKQVLQREKEARTRKRDHKSAWGTSGDLPRWSETARQKRNSPWSHPTNTRDPQATARVPRRLSPAYIPVSLARSSWWSQFHSTPTTVYRIALLRNQYPYWSNIFFYNLILSYILHISNISNNCLIYARFLHFSCFFRFFCSFSVTGWQK